jgi:CRISPR-associated exonuclease Cas4
MFAEDELLPISALAHLLYCERRCALIHLEQLWRENRYTAQGRQLHRRVHEGGREKVGEVQRVRSLPLRSLELGLTGVADVVEFSPAQPDAPRPATHVPGLPGRWQVRPVEYKRGRPKKNACDEVQLCAQAICLEEMLACRIHEGSLFYGRVRRRHVVALGETLRSQTRRAAEELHALIRAARTPPPRHSAKCERCSLRDDCFPKRLGGPRASEYVRRCLANLAEPDP